MDNFKELVMEMRKVQKEYFKTKDANILIKSKQLEGLVDKELEEYEDSKIGNFLF